MKKKQYFYPTALLLTFLTINISHTALASDYTFDDTKHLNLLQQEYYAKADAYLTQVWAKIRKNLPKEEYKKVFTEQKDWINFGRVYRANAYAPEFTEDEAFTQVSFDRAAELASMLHIPQGKKFKYEKSGEVEIVYNGTETELYLLTLEAGGGACELIAHMQGDIYSGWNIFTLISSDASQEPAQISVYNLYDELYISDDYLIDPQASALPSSCTNNAQFKGKYFINKE